jgi:peptidoglycan hydrolase-like protein with peptidoglycan-binding domain
MPESERDGVYGDRTREAVRQFQADHRLKVDGEWGPECDEFAFLKGHFIYT